MAFVPDVIWAIDLGNNSLKALHLAVVGNVVQVLGFDNIQHGKILSGSGIKEAERDELVAISLRQFVQRNDIGDEAIIISVPSQNSFARFVSLPPVEQKRIPEIVRFEAAQQIPFDMDDVQWDWQLMTEADSPEKKVGIFAIKNDVVNSSLEQFGSEDMQVSYVQMVPMALYNYLMYDRPDLLGSDDRATIILDIGAENTDLVVCTKSAVWQRCILMGGNSFTRAIADTFKLNFIKAEKLKRTAPVSKYARQIFQAMKPVFTDLASEVQRSLGFYSSANPNKKFNRIIAMGGGTKLRGLLKYLQQTLQIPVERPDTFKKLAIGSGVSAAKFHGNVSDFGVVYGLALQGLGLTRIESNLLPRAIQRSMAWTSKAKYFIAAACILLVVSIICLARTGLDKISYAKNGQIRQRVGGIIRSADEANNKLKTEQQKASSYKATIKEQFELFKYREAIPMLHEMILSALPNAKTNPEQQELYKAFVRGDVETLMQIPRKERKQLFVTNMSIFYSDDLENAQFGSTAMMRKRGMGGAEGTGLEEYELELMRREQEIYGRGMSSRYGLTPTAGQDEDRDAGFVVTIAGYSPYKDMGELLDPIGVEGQPDKWGFITRLMHLDDIVDGNSPFKLYKKSDAEHFKFERGPVAWDSETPAGTGVSDVIYDESAGASSRGTQVLIDPMTSEIISTVPVLDEFGELKLNRNNEPIEQVNDNWFILNLKFIWKNAPGQTGKDTAGSTATGQSGASRTSTRGSMGEVEW
jgi:type IV pilus assembly protein PilM